MTASAALGTLPEWNLADLHAGPDAPGFVAEYWAINIAVVFDALR